MFPQLRWQISIEILQILLGFVSGSRRVRRKNGGNDPIWPAFFSFEAVKKSPTNSWCIISYWIYHVKSKIHWSISVGDSPLGKGHQPKPICNLEMNFVATASLCNWRLLLFDHAFFSFAWINQSFFTRNMCSFESLWSLGLSTWNPNDPYFGRFHL